LRERGREGETDGGERERKGGRERRRRERERERESGCGRKREGVCVFVGGEKRETQGKREERIGRSVRNEARIQPTAPPPAPPQSVTHVPASSSSP
jgi:hypothetical protein